MGQQASHEQHSSYAFESNFSASFGYSNQANSSFNTSIPQKDKASTQNSSQPMRSKQTNNRFNSKQSSSSSHTTSANVFNKPSNYKHAPATTPLPGHSDRKRQSKNNNARNGISTSGKPFKQESMEPRRESSKPRDNKFNEQLRQNKQSTSDLSRHSSKKPSKKTHTNNISSHQQDSGISSSEKHPQKNPALKVPSTPINIQQLNIQGDTFFASNQLAGAEKFYTRAINKLSKNHSDQIILLNNRANVLLRLGEFERCLQDCTTAIRLTQRSIHNKHSITTLIGKATSSYKDQLVRALYIKAEALGALERYREAVMMYQKIISKDNSLSPVILLHIRDCKQYLKAQGDSLYKQEKFKEAEDVYTEVIRLTLPEKNGDLISLLSNRAASLMMQHEYMECLKDCNAAIDLVFSNMNEKTSVSPLLEKSGNTIESILVKLLFRKARALQALERYHAAIEVYRTILYFDKSQDKQMAQDFTQCKLNLFWEQGNTHYRNNNLKDAKKFFTDAINMLSKDDGDSILFLSKRADILAKQSEYKECLVDCTSLNGLAYKSIKEKTLITPLMKAERTSFERLLLDSLRLQVKAFAELFKWQDVFQKYDSIIASIHPDDTKFMEMVTFVTRALIKERANQCYKNKRYGQAMELYTKGIDQLPTNDRDLILFLNNRAAAYIELGFYKDCLEDCEMAIALANENIDQKSPTTRLMKLSKTTYKSQLIKSYFRQAQAYEALGDYLNAMNAYEKSQSLNSSSNTQAEEGFERCKEKSYRYQGDIHFANGQFAEAQECYTQGINRLPKEHVDLIFFYNRRAAVFMEQENYEKCLEDCKSAIMLAYSKREEHETSLLTALNRKAQALEELTRYKAAIIAYEEIMDIMNTRDMMHNVRRCQELLKKQMEEELEAKTSERVKEMREREKQMKAEKDERAAKEQVVNEKISTWKEGKYGDLRALLGSLDSILWPEVLVKGVKIDSSSSTTHCKKLYMKVIARIHDDKLPHTVTVEQRLLANRVFQVLNESYNEFRILNDLKV